jgi:hypothetical protein
LRSATSKTLFLLASAGAFAALAWSAQQGRPGLSAAPPIRAVDEAPPALVRMQLAAELGGELSGPKFVTATDTFCWGGPGHCTRAAIAKLKAQLAARQEAIRPAAGSEPRAVAELSGSAVLVAWRNGANRLCLDSSRLPAGGGGGAFGPCDPEDGMCAAICLRSDGRGESIQSLDYLLAGTVRQDATAIRVVRSRGAATEYALRGPVLSGTQHRVFMLELGRRDWRLLELLRGDRVIATEKMPPARAAFEDCQESATTRAALEPCLMSHLPVP